MLPTYTGNSLSADEWTLDRQQALLRRSSTNQRRVAKAGTHAWDTHGMKGMRKRYAFRRGGYTATQLHFTRRPTGGCDTQRGAAQPLLPCVDCRSGGEMKIVHAGHGRASLLSPPRGRLEPPHTHARGIITSDGSVRHPGEPLPKFDWIWSIPFIVHSFIASSSPPAYLPRLPDSGVTLPTNLPTSNTQISTIPISNNMRAGTAFPFFPMAGRQHTLTLSTFLSYMTRSKK